MAHEDAWQYLRAAAKAISLCLDGNVYEHLHNKIVAQVTDGKEALILPHVGSRIQFFDELIFLLVPVDVSQLLTLKGLFTVVGNLPIEFSIFNQMQIF